MKIAIGSDHAGFELKELLKAHLVSEKHEVEDFGTYENVSCHYPEYAKKVAVAVRDGEAKFGVLVCSTGIGMSIAANKVKGIRAALVGDRFSAKCTRLHNNANVICFGASITDGEAAKELLDIFISTDAEGGRHAIRTKMISDMENER